MRVYILLAMIFCHIVEDYNIQGILAQFKQKSFWKDKDFLYHNDWIISIIEHGFENTFIMMLPIAIYYKFQLNESYFIWFVWNWMWHCIIDHYKCNKLQINLIRDQSLHMFWIILTWFNLVII